jgi:hypothetical protein
MTQPSGDGPTPRHCEARSAGAIHAFIQRPMDCFVPRNDTDLPPTSRTSIKFVKSVNQENDGHEEEQIYR